MAPLRIATEQERSRSLKKRLRPPLLWTHCKTFSDVSARFCEASVCCSHNAASPRATFNESQTKTTLRVTTIIEFSLLGHIHCAIATMKLRLWPRM